MEQVVKSGAGLAFVSYPEVLAKFDFVPQFFAVLFFLMLITLGLGSAVGFMSAVTTTIFDSFPHVNKEWCKMFDELTRSSANICAMKSLFIIIIRILMHQLRRKTF